jgi:hypothetical protein
MRERTNCDACAHSFQVVAAIFPQRIAGDGADSFFRVTGNTVRNPARFRVTFHLTAFLVEVC